MLAEGVSCVYIATANDSHAPLTKECISLGVPVLCEKPFALSEKEAKEVIDLAKEKKVYVAEAMWTWHDDLSLRVKEIVKSGLVGDVKKAKLTFGINNENQKTACLPIQYGIYDNCYYNNNYVFALPDVLSPRWNDSTSSFPTAEAGALYRIKPLFPAPSA